MVQARESLVGQRFNMLTAIERAEDYITPCNGKHNARYLCKCDCGNECIVLAQHLKRGTVKSCGCLNKTREDLTGQKFNMLTTIKMAEDYITPGNGRHQVQYLCRCDCGNEVIVRASRLKSGHTKSCGHCPINTYKDMGGYMIGYTRKGEEFYFDKEDYDLVKDYTWYINQEGYVVAGVCKKDGIRTHLLMHRLVMGISDEEYDFTNAIDHKKKGKIYRRDNRKSNLWICTSTDNNHNMSIRNDNTSGCSGVTWYKRDKKWRAYINVNGKAIHLGYYTNIEDAIEARRNAELKYWGKCEG